MKPETRQWIDKAEDDFDAAEALLRRRTRAHHDTVCFHAQQCIEKYLKARLVEAGAPFSKTHDLETLLDRLIPVEPLWAPMRSALNILTDYAVDFRYPGETASREQAKEALKVCRSLRRIIREALRLSQD